MTLRHFCVSTLKVPDLYNTFAFAQIKFKILCSISKAKLFKMYIRNQIKSRFLFILFQHSFRWTIEGWLRIKRSSLKTQIYNSKGNSFLFWLWFCSIQFSFGSEFSNCTFLFVIACLFEDSEEFSMFSLISQVRRTFHSAFKIDTLFGIYSNNKPWTLCVFLFLKS